MKKVIMSILLLGLVVILGVNSVQAASIQTDEEIEAYYGEAKIVPEINGPSNYFNFRRVVVPRVAPVWGGNCTRISLYPEDYEKYKDNEISVSWNVNEDITDYEIKTSQEDSDLYSDFDENTIFSESKNTYFYIQTVAQSEKKVFKQGTTLFTITAPIYSTISFGFSYVKKDGTKGSEDVNIVVDELDYLDGDVNRDYKADFFDIVDLISLVYDSDESFVWKDDVKRAANMDEENLETPDFFTIVNLISYMYDVDMQGN